jgi:hypothetical protein
MLTFIIFFGMVFTFKSEYSFIEKKLKRITKRTNTDRLPGKHRVYLPHQVFSLHDLSFSHEIVFDESDKKAFDPDLENYFPKNVTPLENERLLDFNEGDNVALQMIREADNLPETWPALEEMLIDDENRLWASTIVDDFDIYEWWVFADDNGDVITKFEWPRDEPIEVVKNGFMYTRQTDEETGLQQIVRYRIEFEEV